MKIDDFRRIVESIKILIESKKAQIMFENNSIGLEIRDKAPDEISKLDDFNSIMKEMLGIINLILTNSTEVEERCQKDNEFSEKVAIVKNVLIDDKLVRRHRFFTNPTINSVRSVMMYPIIKPGLTSENNMATCILFFEYRDTSGSIKRVELELNTDQIDNLIDELKDVQDKLNILTHKIQGLDFLKDD